MITYIELESLKHVCRTIILSELIIQYEDNILRDTKLIIKVYHFKKFCNILIRIF
jgi:hypothetical protein